MQPKRPHSVIPGFGLTLGYTVSYLSLIVLIPLSAVVVRGVDQPWASFKDAVFDTRTLLAWRLTFGTAFVASLINAFFGLIVAWVLVRYDFPGRRILDALIDMPFALPTAVSGIALTAIYANNGWVGHLLQPLGIKAVFSPLGIVIALTFIGLPFIVRTVQPTIEDLDPAVEEAAALLGRTAVDYAAPRYSARHTTGARGGIRDGVRALPWRVRVCHFHIRQHADEDRDRLAADRDEASAVRLCGRIRDRAVDAGEFVPAVVSGQFRAMVVDTGAEAGKVSHGERSQIQAYGAALGARRPHTHGGLRSSAC